VSLILTSLHSELRALRVDLEEFMAAVKRVRFGENNTALWTLATTRQNATRYQRYGAVPGYPPRRRGSWKDTFTLPLVAHVAEDIIDSCVRKLPGDARVGPKNIFEVAGAGVPGAGNGATICLTLSTQRLLVLGLGDC